MWKFFKRNNETATCLVCLKVLRCKGSSTTGLHRHLKAIHNMQKQNSNQTLEESAVSPFVNNDFEIGNNTNQYFAYE